MFDFYKLRQNKIHKFSPKVEILNDKGPFILKTVSTPEELTEALRLRYQVFHREMIGKNKPNGLDVDEYDFDCDHLIIKDKKSDRIVGTYRLNCSLFSQNFYSHQEFNLRRILEQPGTKLELGRACIHKDFRRGIVISMLWRGIAQYMLATQCSLLFGCASVKTESPRQAALLYHYFLRDERFEESFLAPPSMKFTMPNLDLWITNLDRPFSADEITEAEGLIPSLCKSYLNAGAFLGGEPAYDPEFKCIDFLTILPRENLNKALWKKYSSPSTELPLAANF
jgi:putative hemolysin